MQTYTFESLNRIMRIYSNVYDTYHTLLYIYAQIRINTYNNYCKKVFLYKIKL